MDKYCIFNILVLLFLFIGNIFINTHCYFLLIYLFLFLYHNYIFYLFLINKWKQPFKVFKFVILSIFLYAFTYFIICDPNPIFVFFFYYLFFPNFFKAILIILFHTYFLSIYSCDKSYNLINSADLSFDKIDISLTNKRNGEPKLYFLSNYVKYSTKSKSKSIFVLLIIILIFFINLVLFLNRIKLWIYFNNKEKTLPMASSRNTSFYITAMISNMENIIDNYIEQMKKLIN